MPYKASRAGMKRGYWKIVDGRGMTARSGFRSQAAAAEVAELMNGPRPHAYDAGCECAACDGERRDRADDPYDPIPD